MYAVKMTIKSKRTDEGLVAFAGKRGVIKHNPLKVDAWMRKASAEKWITDTVTERNRKGYIPVSFEVVEI